jgi:peptidoglycan/xylan/chitin deacetylase (PgdA/CDA1 family)
MRPSTPILLYHHIASDREITPQGFENQLRFLLDQGYRSLSMNNLVQNIRGEKTIAAPGFVLTFDDGYQDNYTHAFSILQKLSVQALVYLVTERIGAEGFLSWEQIQAMSASGLVTFGSHTHTHRHFVRRETYQNLEEELMRSKELIETQTKKSCEHFAWPWGDYETEWLALVQKIGYHSAATTLSGANVPGSNPYQLKRVNIRRQSTEWLKSRMRWNASALAAAAIGPLYGLDRRFKVWWNKESPYSHG